MGDHRTCPICGGMFRSCECERWAATIRLLFTQRDSAPPRDENREPSKSAVSGSDAGATA